MPNKITGCCDIPQWLPMSLKAGLDDDFEVDQDEMDQEGFDAVSRVSPDKLITFYEEMTQQLAIPDEWGKGGKRPIAVNQAAKRRVAKKIYEVTKGWHNTIPMDNIFTALSVEGLVPVQEDGLRWQGMLLGDAECGEEDARKQYANIPIAGKNAAGQWCMTTMTLHIQWCKMHSGKYEIVCYLS